MFNLSCGRRIRATACSFVESRGGNIAVIFALALLPILAFIGAAVDYSRASTARTSMQAALVRGVVGTMAHAVHGVFAVNNFFVRRFVIAGNVVILDQVHSYDVYTGTLITQLIRELLALRCSVIVLSATLTKARRQELIAAAGASAESLAYPLVTVARAGAPGVEAAVELPPPRDVNLKLAAFSAAEMISDCNDSAEAAPLVRSFRCTCA